MVAKDGLVPVEYICVVSNKSALRVAVHLFWLAQHEWRGARTSRKRWPLSLSSPIAGLAPSGFNISGGMTCVCLWQEFPVSWGQAEHMPSGIDWSRFISPGVIHLTAGHYREIGNLPTFLRLQLIPLISEILKRILIDYYVRWWWNKTAQLYFWLCSKWKCNYWCTAVCPPANGRELNEWCTSSSKWHVCISFGHKSSANWQFVANVKVLPVLSVLVNFKVHHHRRPVVKIAGHSPFRLHMSIVSALDCNCSSDQWIVSFSDKCQTYIMHCCIQNRRSFLFVGKR